MNRLETAILLLPLTNHQPAMTAHAFTPRTQEAEAGQDARVPGKLEMKNPSIKPVNQGVVAQHVTQHSESGGRRISISVTAWAACRS